METVDCSIYGREREIKGLYRTVEQAQTRVTELVTEMGLWDARIDKSQPKWRVKHWDGEAPGINTYLEIQTIPLH